MVIGPSSWNVGICIASNRQGLAQMRFGAQVLRNLENMVMEPSLGQE